MILTTGQRLSDTDGVSYVYLYTLRTPMVVSHFIYVPDIDRYVTFSSQRLRQTIVYGPRYSCSAVLSMLYQCQRRHPIPVDVHKAFQTGLHHD